MTVETDLLTTLYALGGVFPRARFTGDLDLLFVGDQCRLCLDLWWLMGDLERRGKRE